MGVVSDLVKDVELPKMIKVKQKFSKDKIEISEIPNVVREQIESINNGINTGMTIAIAAGSRGVANIALVTKCIVDYCYEKGAKPFVFPAMGSHGGATAEGQRQILEGYGITEDYIGCPIKSSLEVVKVGETEKGNYPVYMDKYASEADGVIVVNRIKAHTGYRGPYESGIMKMMAIGIGKQKGAETCHSMGIEDFDEIVPLFGKALLKNANILFGLGLIENPYDQTCKIVAMESQKIVEEEPKYLKYAIDMMPKILFGSCDVLIVDYIGKNISGDGIDPNITGRWCTPKVEPLFKAKRVCVLDVTEESHGNTNGMGLADIISKKLYDKFIPEMTYPNVLTSMVMINAKTPMVMGNDKETIQACIKTAPCVKLGEAQVIRIKSTLHLDEIYISESLIEKAKTIEGIEIIGDSEYMKFDEKGNLF